MPNVNKSAAVPFVNQKGERSMKRVKVERYVAGKKPAYAKDEEEEYYTTDDGEDEEMDEEESSDEDSDDSDDRPNRKSAVKHEPKSEADNFGRAPATPNQDEERNVEENEDDDDDDDPRFRRLKQLESKPETKNLLQVQTTSRVFAKIEDKPRIIEDEEEDEIRERHALARARTLEELIETKATLGDFPSQQATGRDSPEIKEELSRRDETEDLLDKIVITRIKPEEQTRKTESIVEEQSKLFVEKVKQESILLAQVHQKIKEDNERELEIEARKKGDTGAVDMESVKTDDEDEEIAYEEWKLREIKRVLRDRSERALESRARG